jgi:hypothetical protein
MESEGLRVILSILLPIDINYIHWYTLHQNISVRPSFTFMEDPSNWFQTIFTFVKYLVKLKSDGNALLT